MRKEQGEEQEVRTCLRSVYVVYLFGQHLKKTHTCTHVPMCIWNGFSSSASFLS